MIAIADLLPTTSIAELQDRFVTCILPRITAHAGVIFRGYDADRQAEFVAEALALGWAWYVRLCERGKDAEHFPTGFVSLLMRAVASGRRAHGMLKSTDVLNERAQEHYGFRVERLAVTPPESSEGLSAQRGPRRHPDLESRWRDNTVTPPPEQVQFQIDFSDWLQRLNRRSRRLMLAMARGERTKDLALGYRLSPARISQLRREFHESWHTFTANQPVTITA
jgi:hypothetical protein